MPLVTTLYIRLDSTGGTGARESRPELQQSRSNRYRNILYRR